MQMNEAGIQRLAIRYRLVNVHLIIESNKVRHSGPRDSH
jgi:hypothetical protein